MFASKNWDYYWLDEQRAFLTADRQDKRPMYAKFHGIGKALYGTKDASRDYSIKIDKLMISDSMQCKKLQMCAKVYVSTENNIKTVALCHVDDFVFGGENNQQTLDLISRFRKTAKTDDPMMNAELVLGLKLSRDKSRRIIKISMEIKINDLAKKFPQAIGKIRNVPMPTTGFIVRDHEYEKLSEIKKKVLSTKDIEIYMCIVGNLIWIQGSRLDILFAVLYLSWYTKQPLQHHLDMAYYVIGYLYCTKDMPLVLGGSSDISTEIQFDSSHGTGPRSRSITGVLGKLNSEAGAVFAKASAQSTVKLSSFETELDGTTTGFKSASRIQNILTEIGIETCSHPVAKNDNESMIEFVKGNNVAKGVRHMELRMWYTREEYQMGKVDFEYKSGKILTADKLTKLGNISDHRIFAADIMGLGLLGYDYFVKNVSVTDDKNEIDCHEVVV